MEVVAQLNWLLCRKPMVKLDLLWSNFWINLFYYSPPRKYKGFRVANTGIDPHGNYLEFIKKDIVRNIDVHRDSDQAKVMRETRHH